MTGIGEAKAKKKKSKEGELPKAEHLRIMAKHVNRQITNLFDGRVVDFPSRYHVVLTPDHQRLLVTETADRTVLAVHHDALKSDLVSFCANHLGHHEFWGRTDEKRSEEFFKYWRLITQPIEDPVILALADYEGLCYNRADFSYAASNNPAKYEAIDRLLGDNMNVAAVKAFLGSILDPDADTQQTLVLHGEGQNGKSTLLNFIERSFEGAVTSSTSPSRGGMKNFTSSFVNKRVGMFPDADDLSFMRSQHFKMMTGGDLIPVDEKWGRRYTTRLSCKFVISSNKKPDLKGEKSDERRIIYYEMPQVARKDGRFLDKLLSQKEAIWRHLMDVYYEHSGPGGEIPVDAAQLDAVLEENSEQEAEFFNEFFRLETDGFVDMNTFNKCLRNYFGSTFAGTNAFKKSFDLWVRRELKLGGKKLYNNKALADKPKRGYRGMALRNGCGTMGANID